MGRTDSFEKTLILGKTEGSRRRGWQRMRWLNGITDSMDMSLSKLGEMVKDREAQRPWGCKESDTAEWLNNNNNPDTGFHRRFCLCVSVLVNFASLNLSVCITNFGGSCLPVTLHLWQIQEEFWFFSLVSFLSVFLEQSENFQVLHMLDWKFFCGFYSVVLLSKFPTSM